MENDSIAPDHPLATGLSIAGLLTREYPLFLRGADSVIRTRARSWAGAAGLLQIFANPVFRNLRPGSCRGPEHFFVNFAGSHGPGRYNSPNLARSEEPTH